MPNSRRDLIAAPSRSRLPPIRIRERAPRHSFSIEFSDLIKGVVAKFARLREKAEGLSTDSSRSRSSNSFGLSEEEVSEEAAGEEVAPDEEEKEEVEDGEEVNHVEDLAPAITHPTQILAVELILMLSSNFKAADDLKFLVVAPATEDLIEHSFNQRGSLGSIAEEEVGMAPKFRALGKKKAAGVKLDHLAPNPILALPSPVVEAPKFAVVELGNYGGPEGVQKQADHERHSDPPASCGELITLKERRSSFMLGKVFDRGFNKARDSYEKQVAKLRLSIFQEADEKGVGAVEVGTTLSNEFMGEEEEVAGEGESKKAVGAEGDSVNEGNPNTQPAE
ncbi:hypothetical protein Acr_27g0001890 [Actinidia rufa]|uniref:Uncharacterized protein n=1 Tax=Actinidia rufa TaxID=165716 RepID=A0A7J0H5T4_9ERIC|nr:hypothetical protein Acr_27g0001890 [Actinidia rufa]